ncbi:hypothetical protein BDD12DRAFT_823644 [Trichophaea hybrida]|nr:hypothetical protein BDD12DRAFT_823644 [Trichophaea hybrida]
MHCGTSKVATFRAGPNNIVSGTTYSVKAMEATFTILSPHLCQFWDVGWRYSHTYGLTSWNQNRQRRMSNSDTPDKASALVQTFPADLHEKTTGKKEDTLCTQEFQIRPQHECGGSRWVNFEHQQVFMQGQLEFSSEFAQVGAFLLFSAHFDYPFFLPVGFIRRLSLADTIMLDR